MAKKKQKKLDRFATFRRFREQFPTLRAVIVDGKKAGVYAQLAALLLWEATDARTGHAKMTVTGLAARMCCARSIARRALAALVEAQFIAPLMRGGAGVPHMWTVHHVEKEEDAPYNKYG